MSLHSAAQDAAAITDSIEGLAVTDRRAGPYAPPLLHPIQQIGDITLDFRRQVALMAIINRTPDSFYDAGATFGLEAAVAAALTAVDDGADWVDIGGVPFAPGLALDAAEEAARVVPVIREQPDCPCQFLGASGFLSLRGGQLVKLASQLLLAAK